MNAKFISVALATAVLIAAAWKISSDKAPQTEVERAALYPGLLERLNDIQRVDLRSAKNSTSLVRAGDSWQVANRDGFPAAFAGVKRTILQIADLDIVEAKTRRADSYGRIGVADVDKEGASGTLIEVFGDHDQKLLGLIAGNARAAGKDEQRYVRRAGEQQSWLVDGKLDVSADPITWLDAKIMDVDATRVSRVTITPLEGSAVIVAKAKPQDNFFELQNVPRGKVPKSKAIVSSLGALLLDLRFNDVAAAKRVAGMTPKRSIEVETFDGLRVQIDEFEDQGKTFARFTPRYDATLVKRETPLAAPANPAPAVETSPVPSGAEPAAASAAPTTVDAPKPEVAAGATTPEDASKPAETVAEEAARLQASTVNWVYELPDYKMRMTNKRLEDLIQDKPSENAGAADK